MGLFGLLPTRFVLVPNARRQSHQVVIHSRTVISFINHIPITNADIRGKKYQEPSETQDGSAPATTPVKRPSPGTLGLTTLANATVCSSYTLCHLIFIPNIPFSKSSSPRRVYGAIHPLSSDQLVCMFPIASCP